MYRRCLTYLYTFISTLLYISYTYTYIQVLRLFVYQRVRKRRCRPSLHILEVNNIIVIIITITIHIFVLYFSYRCLWVCIYLSYSILSTLKDREYIIVDKHTILPTVKGTYLSLPYIPYFSMYTSLITYYCIYTLYTHRYSGQRAPRKVLQKHRRSPLHLLDGATTGQNSTRKV